MSKQRKIQEMDEQKYGWIRVVKYIIIAFLLYCSAAFMNGIIRGAWETSSKHFKPMKSIFSNYEEAQALKTPTNTEYTSIPKFFDALEDSARPKVSDSNLNQDEEVHGEIEFAKINNNFPITISKEAHSTSQNSVSGPRRISVDQLEGSFILPPSEIEKAITETMPAKSNTNKKSSSKSAQNVMSNDQYGSKFSVEEIGKSSIKEKAMDERLNNTLNFQEHDEKFPRNSQESLSNIESITSIHNISEVQVENSFIEPPPETEKTGLRTKPVKSISNAKLSESTLNDTSNQQSVSPCSQIESEETVALDRIYHEESNSIENILADQQTEPFVPPPSVVEETGWRTMPVKSIYNNDKLLASTKNDISNQQSVSPFTHDENGKTVALDRVYNEESFYHFESNSIENILADQQTEPFVPPPSVVEETGWRTMPVKSIYDNNKLLESTKNDISNRQSVSPFSHDKNGKTAGLDRVYNEDSNSIENILTDQQTEPFIPPPVVEETGWRTIPIETNSDENSSSDVKNTHSSGKDNSDIRSTLVLSKPTGNNIEDVAEASQNKEEEEVQIRVLLKKKTKTKSDSHENKY